MAQQRRAMDNFESVQLTRPGQALEMYDFPQSLVENPSDRRLKKIQYGMIILGVLLIISLILSISALAVSGSKNGKCCDSSNMPSEVDPHSLKTIQKIAFGSCTSHFVDPQPIWLEGVIKSELDAWIWLGDFAYLDSTFRSCGDSQNSSQCFECVPNFLKHPPNSCMTGDLDHALAKIHMQLKNPGYSSFLEYMCPGHISSGIYPPRGRDPKQCPRPILGVYDDHDFGWNNGNKRFPQKYIVKEMFLDAMGEAPDSPRRGSSSGIHFKETFNSDNPDRSIDMFFLDERYNRDTLPCHIRRDWCNEVLQNNTNQTEVAWCTDFLLSGGVDGGSCCKSDDIWSKDWCNQTSPSSKYFPFACDPMSDQFGTINLLQDDTGSITTTRTWQNVDQESVFCDVLGSHQRKWLAHSLRTSRAPLKIIVSGSVLFGNPGFMSPEGACTGDDWECYHPAQLNLIHKLGAIKDGCVIVMTGDYHFSDIKVLEPGSASLYADHYQTKNLRKPIYQIMASGMTYETAKYSFLAEPCSEYRKDTLGLRVDGECHAVYDPSFGMLEIDWDQRIVKLQIRDHLDGTKVANGYDMLPMELSIDLETCQKV